MAHAALRVSAIALGAAAMALLAPLWLASPALAKAEARRHAPAVGAVHRPAVAHVFHGGGVRGDQRFVSPRARISGRYAHGYGRHGRGHGYGGAFVVGGGGYSYPYYYSGYGEGYRYGYSRHHSCRWYYYHEPYDLPYRCQGYYSYGYGAPSYGYTSGSYRYGGRVGGHWGRRYAVHHGWRGSTHIAGGAAPTRGARIVTHGGPHFAAHVGARPAARGGHMRGRLP